MPPSPSVAASSGPRSLSFVTAPAFFAAVAFALGIAATHLLYRPPSFLFLAGGMAFASLVFCPRIRPSLATPALLMAWLCAGLFSAEVQPRPLPAPPLRQAMLQWDTPHSIQAIVLPSTRPRPSEDGFDARHTSQLADVALLSIDGVTVGSQPQVLRLTLLNSEQTALPQCGALLGFVSKLHPPPRYYTPGAWDAAAWLAEQNIFAEGSTHADAVTDVPPASLSRSCRLAAARNHALDRLDALSSQMKIWPPRLQFAALSSQDTTMLGAALLGDRSRLQATERSEFQRVGAFHLLVVSGLGIAILAAALWWALRRLRLGRAPATLVTLTILTGYAALTGFDLPVRRALLMTAIYMLGRLLHRTSNPLNALSVAAIMLLAVSPSALAEASLQMTLLAVLSIAGIASPLLAVTTSPWIDASRRLNLPLDHSLAPRLAQFRVTLRLWQRALKPLFGRWLAARLPGFISRCLLHACELAIVSATLQLALAVPMAVYFHRVIALSVGANLLTLPLLGLLLPLVSITLLLATVSLSAALLPAAITAPLLHLASAAVHYIALLPTAEWRTPPTRPGAIALALLCLAFAIALAHQKRRSLTVATVLLTVCAGGLALWSVPLRLYPKNLEITALDVGQGDAIFVASPNCSTLLIDAGGPYGPFTHDGAGDFYGEDIISPYLWSRGIRRLDVVALTHAHSDHMGGMPSVLRNFRPRELWVAADPPIPAYLRLIALAHSLNITVRNLRAGDDFSFGGSSIHVLAPQPAYVTGAAVANDDSLVLHIAFGQTSVLLEGDAQSLSERVMLAAPGAAAELPSDLLKVGHHGSMSSTTPQFLAAVHPRWAVISAGRHNLFGHPRYPILQRLGTAGVHVYRTDLDGASSFLLNGKTVVPIAP